VDSLPKVLEKLATTDKATLAIEKQPHGKTRVTSGSWEGEKVFFRDQVFRPATSRPHPRRNEATPA
jgi:hypothetical protein